jgi:murein DD-endopeptidase MepM/ murein hydrolase activator NlpD
MNSTATRIDHISNSSLRIFAVLILSLIVSAGFSKAIFAQQEAGAVHVSPPVLESSQIYQWESDIQSIGIERYNVPEQAKQTAAQNELNLFFQWPMDGLPQSEHVMHNYVDLAGEGSLLDYMGGTHTYDGHSGTDLSIRSFREMDMGVPVYAVADGVVSLSRNEFDDRNTEWAPNLGPQWNGVAIFHNDSVATRYLHFRKNSVVVEEGEEVKAGDLLGYVGSSGFSTNPHLHFDVLIVDENDNVTVRDPWEGSAQPDESLWTDQLPYLGNETLTVYNTGIATRASMGGEIQFIWQDFVEGLSEPADFGMNEQEVVFWINAQTMPGDQYRVEMLRPNGTLYGQGSGAFNSKARFGYWYFYWNFGGFVSGADYGVWTARIYGKDSEGDFNVVLGESSFTVGSETVWAPRFQPAGKSIRISSEVQQDELTMSEFTGDVTYELVNAPDYVSLNGNVVEFGAESTQPLRSDHFEVVATDQNGRTDTFYYHVVDPLKPRAATSVNYTEMVGITGGEVADEESGVTVVIPDGALAGDTEIEVGRFNVIPDGANTFGEMVLLGPSGLTFSAPVSVTVPYDPETLPEGMSPEDLQLLRYDQSLEEWFVLESSVNTTAQTVTGTTTAFSGFAAGQVLNVSNEELLANQPEQIRLDQNYPNPFNPSTVISYNLPQASDVRLEVFNLLGQRVALLMNDRVQSGRHTVNFDAGHLSSGIYIYRLQAEGFSETRKMLLVK